MSQKIYTARQQNTKFVQMGRAAGNYRGSLRRGGTQTKTTRTSRYNGNLALEREKRREVVELCFSHGDVQD